MGIWIADTIDYTLCNRTEDYVLKLTGTPLKNTPRKSVFIPFSLFKYSHEVARAI